MKERLKRIVFCMGSVAALSLVSVLPVFGAGTWEDKVAADVNTFANIRTEASVDSERIGRLPRGGVAVLTGEENGWVQVSSGDIEGYVRADLVKRGEDAKTLYTATYGAEDEGSVFAEAVDDSSPASAGVSASESDLALMAAIIECEAGGESYEGKVAVGAVIMNRISSGRFPNSLSEVIYQSGQFSPVASGKLARVLSRGASQDCYDAAADVFNGANTIGDKLFFNSGSGRGIQIGNQHFY